ncbi:MAG TPA: hypothetical protein PL105_04530 [Caldilineaceae bacterium]|nr:hypothetical protein [Caldilineaceae bacterium]
MANRVLPPAVSTSEFYLYALLEQTERLADGVEKLVAAVSATSASGSGEMVGLDEERMVTLLSSIKGIGDVTARRIVESYKANVGE